MSVLYVLLGTQKNISIWRITSFLVWLTSFVLYVWNSMSWMVILLDCSCDFLISLLNFCLSLSSPAPSSYLV